MVTPPASIGVLVAFGAELEQVGDIAVELARPPSRSVDTSCLVARAAAPQLADGAADRRQPRPQVLADRRQQRRAQPVALAHRRERRAPRLRAARARAPARPGRAGWSAAAAASRSTGGVPSSRARPAAASTWAPDRTGWNSHSAGWQPRTCRARPARPIRGSARPRQCRSASGDCPLGAAATSAASGSPRRASRCNRTAGAARRRRRAAISSSPLHDSRRRGETGDDRVARGMGMREPRLACGCRRRAGW